MVEDAKSELLTIDELAAVVGMSVRNLREWRTLGLLPAAQLHGRVGYYDRDVVERVEEIKRLRAEGFTLDLIRRMLDAGGDSPSEVMRFARDLRAPFRDDQPPPVDLASWAASWGSEDPADIQRAIAAGLLRERDGALEFTSARIDGIGRALHDLGFDFAEIVAAATEIRRHLGAVAEEFERTWLERIWQPFLDADMPAEQLPALQERLATVQQVAMDAVIALFSVAMEAQIEQGIARETARAAERRE